MKNTKNLTLSGKDKLALIGNLATMFGAGIPILETVQSLLEDAKGNPKKILEILYQDLSEGKRIYESFARFPKIFNTVTVNIIKASEEAGTLDQSLVDLKANIKKEMEFSGKIKSAMIYPALIFMVFGGVMLLMLVYVVPRISSVFLKLKVDLPLPTKILIFVSDFLVYQSVFAISFVAGFILIILYLYKRQKQLLLNVLFSFPLISSMVKDIDLTNFTRSLHLLLYSGIPITTALELTQNTVKKQEIYNAIKHCRNVVLSGRKLSDAFKDQKKIFPSILIKITEAGEKSGSLDKAMLEISEFLDYEVSDKLKTITAIIEPVMLLLVGVLVGGMMLAIIAPIYSLVGSVTAR